MHRADASECRIKELHSDSAEAHPSCSAFGVNDAYLKLYATANNLFVLMRMILPLKWGYCRVTRLSYRLFALTGQIVHHVHQRTLKLNTVRIGSLIRQSGQSAAACWNR